jgi:D-aspartate ligase
VNRAANPVIPAVVVGGGLNALGIVRSLAAAGVPVLVIDTDPQSPAMRSRHGRKLVCAKLEGSGFIDRLLELARDWDRAAMLFVTEEKSVIAVSEYRDRLAPRFHIRMPAHDRLMQLMHKQGFQELAESCAAPVPRTVRLQSLADLPLADKLTFPCVFKPSQKDYAYGARFKKAYKVTSTGELARLYHEIHPVTADMVVQEWIEGADSDIYFCLQYVGADGEPVSSFAGRKIRSWPPRIGGTASCTAAWEDAAELKDMTSLFFRQVGFTGMGSMEYKRDVRDGRFYMVEPTVGRTDFQEEVAALNGVNIPYAAYCYELGLAPAAETRAAVPRIWRDPLSDRWSFEEGDGIADARSQSHAVWDAYWRWNDPLPWIDFTWNRVAAKLGRTA